MAPPKNPPMNEPKGSPAHAGGGSTTIEVAKAKPAVNETPNLFRESDQMAFKGCPPPARLRLAYSHAKRCSIGCGGLQSLFLGFCVFALARRANFLFDEIRERHLVLARGVEGRDQRLP
jgi:hypothetical protein